MIQFYTEAFGDMNSLWLLSKNDLKARFANSLLGIFWAFVQPLVTLLVMWFVFQVGFRNSPVSDVPFIIWLAPAYLVWSFFSETLVSGTNCLIEYSYLVKKVNFSVNRIPVIKIISSSMVHCAFIAFMFFMMVIFKIPFSIYNIQIIYYFFSLLCLLMGCCWLLSAIVPFIKDVVSLVGVAVQIGFWATPIFWSPEDMSKIVQQILTLNPMFYICQGYRESLVTHVWFWEKGAINFVFWGITAFIFLLGSHLFKKLRPQFADVL